MSKVGSAYKDNGLDATPLAEWLIAESTNDWSNGVHSRLDVCYACQSAILLSAVFTIRYLNY